MVTLTILVVFVVLLGNVVAWKVSLKKAAAAGLASLSIATPALAAAIPAIGTPAPSFQLPSNRGKDISLDDYKGKRLVLYTYPGDFTSGCTIEAQAFERDFAKYKDIGVEILGLSVDSVEKHLDFAKSYNLEFPLVSDKVGLEHSVISPALTPTPYTFL